MTKSLINWIVLVLLTAATILALFLPHFLVNTSQQTVILTVTLVAILWYAWETRKMQKAMADQTGELIYQRRLSVLPKFSVGFTRHQAPFGGKIYDCLELVNIGNGTAVNITIDDIEVTYEGDATAWLRFQKSLFIEPTKSNSKIDKVAPLVFFIHNENVASDDILKAVVPEMYRDEPAKFLQEHTKEHKITLLIRFQDIDGTKYVQSAVLGLEQDKPYPLELGVPRIQPDE